MLQLKGDDFLGGASFTVQDIINNASGDEVPMELVLTGGLCKDKGEATVSLSARFAANSGMHRVCVAVCIHLIRGAVGVLVDTKDPLTDEVTSLVVSTMTTDKTDAILEKVGLQTNGDMFKDLLKAANLAADGSLQPLMYFDNETSHTQVRRQRGVPCLQTEAP